MRCIDNNFAGTGGGTSSTGTKGGGTSSTGTKGGGK